MNNEHRILAVENILYFSETNVRVSYILMKTSVENLTRQK